MRAAPNAARAPPNTIPVKKNLDGLEEYVAVYIDICPWQDPMQFGIKLKVMPYNIPGVLSILIPQQSSITRSFADAQFV